MPDEIDVEGKAINALKGSASEARDYQMLGGARVLLGWLVDGVRDAGTIKQVRDWIAEYDAKRAPNNVGSGEAQNFVEDETKWP